MAASCDEKGITSVCPPLPLYQSYPLGDAAPADAETADSAKSRAAFAAAVDAGCVTPPSQFPFDASAGAAGQSNDAGAGGESSDAGAAGQSNDAGAGGSAAGDAGAAGVH